MTHQPAISFSISFLSPFNRAGGRTSNVGQKMMKHEDLFPKLIGLPVSHVWFSDYSVVYFELGELTPSERTRRDGSPGNPDGEITVYAGFDWRIERARSIVCSRNDSQKRRYSVCESVLGSTVVESSVFGRIPELNIGFSSGLWLVTFGLSRSDPQWSIGFRQSGSYLSARRTKLILEPETK